MGVNLYWRPVIKRIDKHRSLPDALKRILARRYFDQDGTLSTDWLETQDMDYLQGVADAGVEGAEELLKAIEKYGSVEIRIAE